ncbi:MAG: hypothetical protein RDU83_13450 [bacterium]|nr:hypothetical protein [bacterium]
MMKRAMAVLGAAAVIATLATPALAQMMRPGMGPGRMPGYFQPGGVQPRGPALPVDQAITRVRQFVGQYGNPDLVPVEIIEFSNVYYAVVTEKSTGKGAFGLLVDRYNGNVTFEMGPPMMWNLKYGRLAGGMGMMGPGGMMGSGMGYGPQPSPGAPGARPPVAQLDEAKARAALQAWIAQAFPGAGIGKVVEFPGFFTYRLARDGKNFALASVNAYGGQVWYAWHYGTVIREQVIR